MRSNLRFWCGIFCAFAIIQINGFSSAGAVLNPEVIRISPDSGPTDGGFEVTTRGLFVDSAGQILRDGITCQFGSSSVNAVVINARTITCTAPSSEVGSTSFVVLVNGQQWSDTTLTFNYYSCSALTGSDPCKSCFALPLCGLCIPTMQCSSEVACAYGFSSKCPEITYIYPNSTSIVGGTNVTITFDIAIPSVNYRCSYGGAIASTATPATVISSNIITCKSPTVTNWAVARMENRELIADLGIQVGTSALLSAPITLFDCDTYGQDCDSCNSARTNGDCAFCFDTYECRYSSASCVQSGPCSETNNVAITSVSPVYISTVQSGGAIMNRRFAFLNGQTFYCSYYAGDIQGQFLQTLGTLTSLTSITCPLSSGVDIGTHKASLLLKNSISGDLSQLFEFTFFIYDCLYRPCRSCFYERYPECVYCASSASCQHMSQACTTIITTNTSCPNIGTILPKSVPTIGGLITVNGSFDASVLAEPVNASCVWYDDLTGFNASLASFVTPNELQCLAPAVDYPKTSDFYLSLKEDFRPWTYYIPFSWFDCANSTGSCDDCLSISQTCNWCVTHCAMDCRANHTLTVCPTIISISPSLVHANSKAQQVIRVTGGPFFNDVEYQCRFDDLTASFALINESVIDCNVPVFLTGNTTLQITANDIPYTNAIDVEAYGTSLIVHPKTNVCTECHNPINDASSSCSSLCTRQAHCGWCVASSTCAAIDFCAQEEVFLDECLEVAISPAVFSPAFNVMATIVVSPQLPQVWFSSKRSTLSVSGIYCELSTGDSIPAIVTSQTTLTCDIPKLTTSEPVTLTIKYQNQTLIAPVTLLTFDCAPFTSCEQCPSSQCAWCENACVIDYSCSQRQNCQVTAPSAKLEVIIPAVVVPSVVIAVVVIVLVVLLKRRKRRRSNKPKKEMTSLNGKKLLQEEKKHRREEKQRLADEKKSQREEQRKQSEASKLRSGSKGLQDQVPSTPSSVYVEHVADSTHYNVIDSTTSKRKTTSMIPIIDSINEKMKIPFDSLEMKREVGAGSYGKVYLGQWQGAKVAIKVCASVANIDGFFDEAVLTIGLPPHPNVVQTFGISVDGALPCIVLEYCGGGSLDKKLFDEESAYSFEDKVRLIKGIAHGLLHLHKHSIIHRDLAARNILLTRGGKPKISDFGMSRLLKEESQKGQTKTNVGPLRWMAPESIKDMSYSTKSDVWTFGILMYEILSGSEPHTNMDMIDVAMKIKNESYHPVISPDWNEHLKSILFSCWQPDPDQRPTMQEIAKKLQDHFASDEDSD